nr:histone arginine methyltransferase CARMER [Hymenolepis microstoma]
MLEFSKVILSKLSTGASKGEIVGIDLNLELKTGHECGLTFKKSDKTVLFLSVKSEQLNRWLEKDVFISVNSSQYLYIITFSDSVQIAQFMEAISDVATKNQNDRNRGSVFDARTDTWSAVQYFQFYSYLGQQQNMMQDYVRTSTYQRAILANSKIDFLDKIVLDVGAGSGILSFFAIQAGAKRVYAVEASNMAEHCKVLVQSNNLSDRIIVVSGKIEEITLPESVDVIISEPMGYMLYNERMLETYVHARKFLAPQHRAKRKSENGLADTEMHDASTGGSAEEVFALCKPGVMFPSVGKMFIAPFSDESLFAELYTKSNFWYQQSFHGMDLTALREAAVKENFSQPVVDTFDISICPVNEPCVDTVDFRSVAESDLANICIPLEFTINQCTTIHGLAFWFEVGFLGSETDIWLSTSPTEQLTHWYQVRCLLGNALLVQEGQVLTGHVKMVANSRQSYDVEIELVVPTTGMKITNHLDLKNPLFRYTGYPPAPPPGYHSKSPTETYYNNVNTGCALGQVQQQPQQAVTAAYVTTNAVSPVNTATPGTLMFPTAAAVDHDVAAPMGMISTAVGTVIPQSVTGLTLNANNADILTNGWTIGGQPPVLNQAGGRFLLTPQVDYSPRTSIS